MRRSTDRILTTHTGSLPRPPALLEALIRRDRGEPVDVAALDAQIADAVADVVRFHRAGLLLQLDCPDLALSRHRVGAESAEGFRRFVRLHIEAIDHATRDIPPDAMRMHPVLGQPRGAAPPRRATA
jgi:methionine synthase II (cobalamin-independent)